jgi:CheY-like chemotaxis protein
MSDRKQVLLVDDDEDIRDVIKEILSLEGIDAQIATNGEEAMERLKTCGKPDLILLDLMMPKTDGIWFCKEREKHPEFSDIPVIVLSADGQVGNKTSGLHISGILKKPIKIDDLFHTIHTYVV